MSSLIVVVAPFEQHYVGLWFADVVQARRPLDAYDGPSFAMMEQIGG